MTRLCRDDGGQGCVTDDIGEKVDEKPGDGKQNDKYSRQRIPGMVGIEAEGLPFRGYGRWRLSLNGCWCPWKTEHR